MKNGLPAFPEKDTFYQLLDKLLPNGEPLYESTFDAFLNTHYGVITDEYPEMWLAFYIEQDGNAINKLSSHFRRSWYISDNI